MTYIFYVVVLGEIFPHHTSLWFKSADSYGAATWENRLCCVLML